MSDPNGIDTVFTIIRTVAGLVAFGVLVYMSYLTGFEDFSLTWHIVFGMLAAIVLIMYGPEELGRLLDRRGGHRD